MNRTPPKFTGNLNTWASLMYEYLQGQADVAQRVQPQAILLASQVPSKPVSAAVDGILMYDPVNGCVVVSINNVWEKLAIVP